MKNENLITGLVSIITPCYNSAAYIKETIDSVRRQTYNNWEMIIVDDCSTDNSVEIIESHIKEDARIRLVIRGKNSGVAAARNDAMKLARGQYVAFLDSDDEWMEEKLEKQIQFMETKGYKFSFTSYQCIDKNGLNLNKVIHAPKCVNWQEGIKNTIIGCLTVMVDISETGKFYMPELTHSEDQIAWLRLNKRGFDAYGLDETLACYRVADNSLSGNKFKSIVSQWVNYRDELQIPFCPRCYYWACYVINAIKKRVK